MAESEPIFSFMYLRPVEVVGAEVASRDYVHDVVDRPVRIQSSHVPSPVTLASESVVARIVSELVFDNDHDATTGLAALKDELLALLVHVRPVSGVGATGGGSTSPSANGGNEIELAGTEFEKLPHIRLDGQVYLLPTRLDELPLGAELKVVIDALETGAPYAPTKLKAKLSAGAGSGALSDQVFGEESHASAYRATSRGLFDALYLLYMLRRWAAIDLDPVMRALRALHVLDALAVDELVEASMGGTMSERGARQLAVAARFHRQLAGWPGDAPAPSIPLMPDAEALAAYWTATPVIHPLFATLFHYLRPFNDITPIGVGDLKVVKQKLLGYEAGEISDIHNVMKGESNLRRHRRLEKTEEQFSSSSSSEEEAQRDSQSTDRSEVKREAENVIKVDVGGQAGTSVTYNQGMVTATVTAGFAASYSGTKTEKAVNNFSKEVIAKAVDRVVRRASQQRNTTKTFETEELNRHTLTNEDGTDHVSGIYRWVDKRYEAQVYNYGKRMMFEFIVPEPGAFLVEQRVRGFEAALQMPIKPTRARDDVVNLPFQADSIDEALFRELKAKYDLAEFEFPARQMNAEVLDPESGNTLLRRENTVAGTWSTLSGKLSVPEVRGYDVDWLWLSGNIVYSNRGGTGSDENLLVLRADGGSLLLKRSSQVINEGWAPDYNVAPDNSSVRLTRDDARVRVEVQDSKLFELMLAVRLSLSSEGLLDWQRQVYNAVARMEQTKVDAANAEKQLAFESAMTTYNNRLDELRAVAVNDLLQGRSEDYNRTLMRTELKRLCLSLLTKEYDADQSDDLLTDWETMGAFDVVSEVVRMRVDRDVDPATARFDMTHERHHFPAVVIPEARAKGKYIQFLEQAFEWEQLGWVCYPYFWAATPKWIKLTGREDRTDPALSAFFQAGAAKVLLAVSPEYDQAVLHWLATREPWQGGSAPALGDPLYLPLYEELRKAQDDLFGATPVGDPWQYVVPTSLVWLDGSADALPDFTSPQT